MDYKIHIAYGFHVNCYHSYRGDTNDNLGFGSDIRIIRKILDTLTALNRKGIPVKGTWDCENFFSLEKILPEYAPDIIEKMKERVALYGDEQIIMGYSNGALGAMTDAELTDSIERAVTNEQGSGLADIFTHYEKIVRPQEVMFTPSQVSVYNKLGVKALCLYYSCVPFDAFRTVIPRLDDEKAFNPLKYTYKGESITVIPTYSNPDVCDAGCLRAWVKELHAKQLSGEIKNDLFIFINMDADAIFWETLDIPVIKGRIANTDGIHGLVTEISDLDYIVFDTPGGYLENHGTVGEISFTHDTADGNFTGYASWAEKPYNRKVWTDIERSRAYAKVNAKSDELSPSFDERIKLLSTTHFGLATPVLNIQREKKADELSDIIIEKELAKLPKTEKITVHNINGTAFQCVQLKPGAGFDGVGGIKISGSGLKEWGAVSLGEGGIFALLRFDRVKKKYKIEASFGEKRAPEAVQTLKTGSLELKIADDGAVYSLTFGGKKIGGRELLKSFITYDGKRYGFMPDGVKPLECAGEASGAELRGEIHLPGEKRGGSFKYQIFTLGKSPAIFIAADINYPETEELTSISTENSALGRFSDMRWQEAAMCQLTPHFYGDISVVKRNFAGDISEFRTQSFPESDEKNKELASFNHQLTAGLVGLKDEETAFYIASARQVLGSMAHCPMRLEADKTVRMNPFGTYFGSQRHHWSRANGEILDTYTLVTPQGRSIAPAYNGNSESFILALYCAKADEPVPKEALAFADGAVVTAPENAALLPYTGRNVRFKEIKAENTDEKKLKSPVLTGLSGNLGKYISRGTKAIGHIIRAQVRAKKQ